MKKKLVSLSLTCCCLLLTACGSSDKISELNNLSALNTESSVTDNYALSYTDEQEMIYAQVSDRQLLDLSALSACSENELNQVITYMNQVDNQLIGNLKVRSYSDSIVKDATENLVADEAVLDSKLTDYLLTAMQESPYYWQRAKTIVRGIDSKSRSIIVDVTYKTINYKKTVKDDSTITKGDPDYDKLAESRYNKYINILSTRLNNPNDATLPKQEADFLKYWGKPSDIINEQNEHGPTTDIYLTGNQKTYTGMIDSEAEKSGGSMTVRYVLVPKYVLGVNLGITCKHMYITDFQRSKDCTEGLEAFTKEGYQTVTDSVYNLIYSYFTCMDESDFDGLYKLTNNFQGLDKHYSDLFDSAYQKHEGFSVSLFDITGTHIKCGVTISTKERPKNSNMMFPVYTDRYYMELELVDDQLKVSNMALLSRKLEGEPAISDDEVDTTGFTASVDLDNDDKVAIEKLICDFSATQLSADTKSDSFSSIVDTSIPQNQLSALKTNMTSLSGAKKVVFMNNYQQGTSNYASVRCKELYQDKTNAIVEAESTYEFILKGGRWYIYNYDVNSSVKLDTTNLSTTGSLCLVTPGKVESYTSQIKGTASTNLDEVSDISVSYTHEQYIPRKKKKVAEKGLVLVKGEDVTEEQYNSVASVLDYPAKSATEFKTLMSEFEAVMSKHGKAGLGKTINNKILDGIAVYVNTSESRYPNAVAQSDVNNATKESLSKTIENLKNLEQGFTDVTESEKTIIANVTTMLENVRNVMK